jgi:hypothetical protein
MDDTVDALKQKIYNKEDILPSDGQLLTFAGKDLKDGPCQITTFKGIQ